MGRRTRQYVLDKRSLSYHKTFSGSAPCIRCHKPFKLGDSIVSKQAGRTGSKYYHGSCYDSMFV